ncbi:hypothetical protein [Streptococcus sp. zg-JUN1979]|uniref:hypothetical protein n=1 Tax=Streptococcus sp. zg-JUN1979 TaxID=3391450 RepID=UPI0039A6EFB0
MQETTGSNRNPKPKYSQFDSFFNYEEELNTALGRHNQYRADKHDLADVNRLMNDYLNREREVNDVF